MMNRTIWITWFQGWDNAPEISQKCLESWKHYNPDWNIIQLDSDNYKDYCNIDKVLPGLRTNNISLSDILRLFLLKENGGVWVDSTLFCNKPLDLWIYDINDSFLFTREDKMIATWFIATKSNSHIIDVWYNNMVKYWKYRISETDQFEQQYGWIHEIFKKSYGNNTKFRDIFDSWDKIDCSENSYGRGNGPHLFVPYEKYFYNKIADEIKNRIDSKVDPVYKLSYKVNTNWRSKKNRNIHPDFNKIKLNIKKKSELDYLLKF